MLVGQAIWPARLFVLRLLWAGETARPTNRRGLQATFSRSPNLPAFSRQLLESGYRVSLAYLANTTRPGPGVGAAEAPVRTRAITASAAR